MEQKTQPSAGRESQRYIVLKRGDSIDDICEINHADIGVMSEFRLKVHILKLLLNPYSDEESYSSIISESTHYNSSRLKKNQRNGEIELLRMDKDSMKAWLDAYRNQQREKSV